MVNNSPESRNKLTAGGQKELTQPIQETASLPREVQEDITPDLIDLKKSWEYRNKPVIILLDNRLVCKESDRWSNPEIYEIQKKVEADSIVFIPDEKFESLKEYLLKTEVEEDEEDALLEEENPEEIDDTKVARELQFILIQAKKKEASDVHIIPEERRVRVEFRVNGELELFKKYSKGFASRLINKIKILADIDMTKHHIPQDGKMKIKVGGDELEIRVSIVPTVYGEDAVLRVQKTQALLRMNLKEIGFEEEDYELYRSKFLFPYGMILDVGGTGEGKTTTLYLTLKEIFELYGHRKRILTVEDPVELKFPQAVQVEVDEKAGRTFPMVLRAFLRQDPDIMLVGEIRDEETAQIAVRAALTGHLVLSTLHATDSFNAIVRLEDLGVSRFLISSTVNVLLSQRLVRVLCPKCRKKIKLSPSIVSKYSLDFNEAYEKGEGCEYCNYTGVVGRTAVIEVLPIDGRLKELIATQASEVEMKKAMRGRFRNLWDNAILKVKRGITSLSEVESKIKPDPILNLKRGKREVDLGIVLYPHKKIIVAVKGKEGYLYDVSHSGLSIYFKEPFFLEQDVPIAGVEVIEKSESGEIIRKKEITFTPKSYKKFAGGGFLVGGFYEGDLKEYLEM